jgi:hypothetical protein
MQQNQSQTQWRSDDSATTHLLRLRNWESDHDCVEKNRLGFREKTERKEPKELPMCERKADSSNSRGYEED